jgi:hypothetical protein
MLSSMRFDLDFGSGYKGQFTSWSPDRELNPQYNGIPDVERYGLMISHPDARDPSKRHVSMIIFDGPVQAQLRPNNPRWQVESWEPLTISPSILCTLEKGGCGAHGFIRNGAWVPA